jgi:uncharacterized protein (TIGR03435 family)
LLVGIAIISVTLVAQTPASFEVASVKPNNSGANSSSVDTQPNGRLVFTNETVRGMIERAYQLQPFQVIGAPAWTATARFDLAAKAPEGVRFAPPTPGEPPPPQLLMLRSLLAARFKLRVHTEKRETTVYALVIARPGRALGPRLSKTDRKCDGPAAGPPTCGLVAGDGEIQGGAQTIARLASQLSRRLGRVISDETQLPGNYDFSLRYATDVNAATDQNLPSAETALQEQLGLKIEARRVPSDVLVIDHVERPSED